LYSSGGQKIEEAWEEVLSAGEWTGELRQRTKDDDELIVESRWTLVGEDTGTSSSVLVINTDITERKRLESNILRGQRMESIGTLVGGIAHDLGNLLVPILLGVNVLSNRYSDDEKSMRTLEMIRRSAERGSEMVKQVLAFARGVEGERVPLKLDEVFEEVEKITTETFPTSINVRIDIDDDLPHIVGDATQIQQVIINLCVNARDAMPDGGCLDVQARPIRLDASDARANPDAEDGEYICISVSDTGVGISPNDLDKVFEPYFTTKSADEGTGLGLSTVYSIVTSHEGFVDVYSEVGKGTTFNCFLPLADENVGEARADGSANIDVGTGHGEAVVQGLEE
ncbi:MAG: ATP-binding protein, partial [Rhodothermales bacterium]